MINNFDVTQNFWDLYPDFKIALSFKEIYKSDKSRNKESSSKLMWFVALTTDLNSKYYRMPQDDRFNLIAEDYMEDIKYYKSNKIKIDKLIEDYIMLEFSAAQRQLREWDIKQDERSAFIATLKYSLDTYEDLDKMAVNTKKIYDTFKTIKDDLAKEESGEGTGKAGAKKSLND